MTTTLHTETTSRGQSLSRTENGATLYTIAYVADRHSCAPWHLLDATSGRSRWFRTMEGAQYFALYLEAEQK